MSVEVVTANSLTEMQIRAVLELARSTKNKALVRRCAAALVPNGRRVVAVWWDARERVAAVINAITKETP